jgi:hypothetical protein
MASIFSGSIEYPVTSQVRTGTPLPQKIVSFSLVNKTAGANTVEVTLDGVSIYSNELALGEMYESNITRILEANKEIAVNATGSVDFYFTMFNLNPNGGEV